MESEAFTPRPQQKEVLSYTGGKMGVAAVPGSGKTLILSWLAARLLEETPLEEGQEVLVVTLVNSAVDNFYRRVSATLRQELVRPGGRFLIQSHLRVRTLHGLAHDIVRERPDLAGLPDRFSIFDERLTASLRSEAVDAWLESNPQPLDAYLDAELDEDRREWARREGLPGLAQDIAAAFIAAAKDLRLAPEDLAWRLDALPAPLPLAHMGLQIYQVYQRLLARRGGVDFDDLIRLALDVMESDPDFLQRMRRRWPFILEDEAQDSSRLQQAILEMLAGENGNWVRVGDPNQAIYETFTTANPAFLREFLARPDVRRVELPHSGRSTFSLINLANRLVDWTMYEHPLEAARDALQAPPYIQPVPPGDPQPNPPEPARSILFARQNFSPYDEIEAIAASLERWLPENPDKTVAVLAPRNARGFDLVNELRRRQIPYEDSLLRSSSVTRFSAGALANLFSYLGEPQSARGLSLAYRVWKREVRWDEAERLLMERAARLIRHLPRVEDYLWPDPERDWLDHLEAEGESTLVIDSLTEFRELARRWLSAASLPADQLVLALSQDLLTDPAELATAHKLSGLLRQVRQEHPDWRLPELASELVSIARNERRYLGFSPEETGFDPDLYPGKVAVATMHKAKGLEWDRVYLMSVNSLDFPSGEPDERYLPEKWYLRERLNLEAEALAQLEAAVLDAGEYVEGRATAAARLDFVRERLRLLYVAITRARQELIVTYHTGRSGDLKPALALTALWDS